MKNSDSIDRVIQVNDISIGENIRRLRKERGMYQSKLVVALQLAGIDISVFSYNRIEKGTQNPTVSLLLALCSLLDCDMNELFAFSKTDHKHGILWVDKEPGS